MLGIGINEEELKKNHVLTQYRVQDLNRDPSLPADLMQSGSIDAIICNVSIDYFTNAFSVVDSTARALKPSRNLFFSFSNRCFPSKVISKWLHVANDKERCEYVSALLHAANEKYRLHHPEAVTSDDEHVSGLWYHVERVVLVNEGKSDPMYVVQARRTDAQK